MSVRPPNGSMSSPGVPDRAGRQAIAFIVKSRRARSSCSDAVNATLSGRRWSVYSASVRYVVTSISCAPERTTTVPKRLL